ncbi:MAG TPA: hypothetical protein VGB45_15320 [Abditibacterium sp.]
MKFAQEKINKADEKLQASVQMKYDFHIHDTVRVEYRVATNGPSFPRGYAQIEHETRSAGGNGTLAACALAKWGAKVLLTGNAIGGDEHGSFLAKELTKVPNLTFEPQVDLEIQTPYAILLKAGTHDVGTLLSVTAAQVVIQRLPQDPTVAGFFIGDNASFGEIGTSAILREPTQDYEALINSLASVSACYLSLLGAEIGADEKAAFVECVVEKYKASFGGPQTVPTLEEIEAWLNDER